LTKIRLFKALIRPVVTYGAEAWRMKKKEKQARLIFERKKIREIYKGNGIVARIEN
jgi:hypothetical protein